MNTTYAQIAKKLPSWLYKAAAQLWIDKMIHKHFCPDCSEDRKLWEHDGGTWCRVEDDGKYPCTDHIMNHVTVFYDTPEGAMKGYEKLNQYPYPLKEPYEYKCPCGSSTIYVHNQESKTQPGCLCHILICVDCGKFCCLISKDKVVR